MSGSDVGLAARATRPGHTCLIGTFNANLTGAMWSQVLGSRVDTLSETRRDSAAELCPQIKTRAGEKHGVVRNEGNTPTDRGGGDPQIGVVMSLVQGVTDQSALVAELRDKLHCLLIDG
jgi:hypothetical protein